MEVFKHLLRKSIQQKVNDRFNSVRNLKLGKVKPNVDVKFNKAPSRECIHYTHIFFLCKRHPKPSKSICTWQCHNCMISALPAYHSGLSNLEELPASSKHASSSYHSMRGSAVHYYERLSLPKETAIYGHPLQQRPFLR
jgi:hypothetical protein